MDITSFIIGQKTASGGGITPTGTINISQNGTTDVTAYAEANVNVQPDLESKSITITENTTTVVQPTAGKDGLSSVSITTNVPQPSGKITITQNGTDIDVSSYATADVNVSGGGDLSEYFNDSASSTGSNNFPGWNKIIKKIPNTVSISGTSMNYFFVKFFGYADDNIELPSIDVSNITSFKQTFRTNNIINRDLDLSSWNFNSNITDFEEMFGNSNFTNINLSSLGTISTNSNLNLSSMFLGNSRLKKINMSNFTYTGNGTIDASLMFYNCSALEEIDMSKFDFTKISSNSSMFQYVPTNCLIYVKDQTAKDWFTTNWPSLTNIQIKA